MNWIRFVGCSLSPAVRRDTPCHAGQTLAHRPPTNKHPTAPIPRVGAAHNIGRTLWYTGEPPGDARRGAIVLLAARPRGRRG